MAVLFTGFLDIFINSFKLSRLGRNLAGKPLSWKALKMLHKYAVVLNKTSTFVFLSLICSFISGF